MPKTSHGIQDDGARVIGRMYFVSPSKGEQFFLRLLLTIVEGGKNWEHLRTWNGQVFSTFKEACMARGLLEDDHEWRTRFSSRPPAWLVKFVLKSVRCALFLQQSVRLKFVYFF